MGPNGSGKTTTINCILALLSYDKGSITVFGEEMSPSNYNVKNKIGVVMQDVAVFDELTVYENIDYFCGLYINDSKLRKQYVDEAIEFVGLNDYRKFRPKKLSGGLLRRLNIACGIAHKPELIILDEPTVAVDPQSRNHILQGIKKLNEQGATIIYTSHYMEEVEAICDRVGIMDFGKLIAVGTIDQLVTETVKEEFATIEINNMSLQLAEAIKRIPGVTRCERNQNVLDIQVNPAIMSTIQLLEMLISKRIDIQAINVEKPTLETVFLTLTGKKLRD